MKATFGAGCFWGVEAQFRRAAGVTDTAVGYSGGETIDPTYRDVCGGGTGHAEVVQVDYDPAETSYEQLLEIFFACHDPTQKDRQGPDVGSQYRSAIFYHDGNQETAARAVVEHLTDENKFARPIVTEIVPSATFYRAEEYHQRYFEKTGQAHC